MKVYSLTLSGGGDTNYDVVDKETWDWIFSGKQGRPVGNTSASWIDQTVPPSILARLKKQSDENGDKFEGVNLTSGSWENDRMLQAPTLETFYSLKDLTAWIKKHRHVIVDSAEGAIY